MPWKLPFTSSFTKALTEPVANKGDGFSFASIPGLKIDTNFSNASSITTTAGGFITLAADQSGNGNNFAANGSAAPLYANSRANFLANGDTNFMSIADNPTLDWTTAGHFVVFDRTSANASFETLVEKGAGTAASREFHIFVGNTNRIFGAIYVRGSVGGERGGLVSGACTVGQTHIADMQYDGINVRVRRNGGPGNQVVVSAASAFNSTSNLFMGAQSGSANPLKSPIKRYLMYVPAPTSAQYDEIMTNLASQYGVTLET